MLREYHMVNTNTIRIAFIIFVVIFSCRSMWLMGTRDFKDKNLRKHANWMFTLVCIMLGMILDWVLTLIT